MYACTQPASKTRHSLAQGSGGKTGSLHKFHHLVKTETWKVFQPCHIVTPPPVALRHNAHMYICVPPYVPLPELTIKNKNFNFLKDIHATNVPFVMFLKILAIACYINYFSSINHDMS